MYKFSKFNEIVEFNNSISIFNYYTKSIVCLTNVKSFSDLDRVIRSKCDLELEKNLIEKGILVGNEIDENKRAVVDFGKRLNNNCLQLTILPTEQCDFRCSFCYEEFNNIFLSEGHSNSLVKYLKKNLNKYNSLSIDWFGGEPLLEKERIINLSKEMIEVCNKLKRPYSAGITTNGYNLNLETFKELLKAKISNFHVTLCGPEEIHDRIRFLENGSGTFEKIIKNLTDIKTNIKSNSFNIIIRINVTKALLDNLEKFMEFLNFSFSNDKRFTFYFRPVGNWGGDAIKNIKDDLLENDSIFFNKILESNVSLNHDIYVNFLRNPICNAAFSNSYVIRANGIIGKCTESLYSEYNNIGYLDLKGNMIINEDKYINWIYPDNSKDNCLSCHKNSLCHNMKCANTRFREINYSTCGHEDKSIDSIIKLLVKTNNKNVNYLYAKEINK